MKQHSIVGRSLLVTAAFVAGHLFNYALLITANRLLTTNAFGRLYTSISLLNVLYAPTLVLAFLFAQHFTIVFTAGGRGALVPELTRLLQGQLKVGSAVVVVAIALLLIFAPAFGVDAILLLVLVPITALAIYLCEMLRAALQGMLSFAAYGAAWISWCAGQYVFAVMGIALTGSAWAGMAGIFAGTALVIVVMFVMIARGAGNAERRAAAASWPAFRVLRAVPFAVEYGTFVLVNNMDILIAYLVLGNDALGIYAASAVFPKAIVTATQPVSQVMLPVMTASGQTRAIGRATLIKALALAAAFGAAGAAVLYLGRNVACDARFGLRACSQPLLIVLALAALPLSILRVLVVACLALGRKANIVTSMLALTATALAIFAGGSSAQRLAEVYLACCWGFFAFYSVAMWSDRGNWAKPGSTSP